MSLDAQIRAAERAGDQAEVERLRRRAGEPDERRHWFRGQLRNCYQVMACGLPLSSIPLPHYTTYSGGPQWIVCGEVCEDCAAVYDRDPAYPKTAYP